MNDHIRRKGRSRTVYFFPDRPSTVIDERIGSAQNTNRLETDIHFESNQVHHFLSNQLHFSKEWISHLGNINNGDEISQRVCLPSVELSDGFRIIKTRERKGYNAGASAGFKRTPQNLTIYEGLYPDIFNKGKAYEALRQNVTMTSAFAKADFSLFSLFSVGGIKFDPELKARIDYSKLESGISVSENGSFSPLSVYPEMSNDLDWYKCAVWGGISLRYDYRNLKIRIGLPLSYNGIFIDNQPADNRNDTHLFQFEPSINLHYRFTSSLNFVAGYTLNNSTSGIQSVYTGYILQDYRTLNRYDGLLPKMRSNNASAFLEYKNLVRMWFGNAGFFYYRNKNNLITDQYFEGILSVTSRIPVHYINKGYDAKVRLSKGFDFAKTLIALELAYHFFSSRQLRQGILTNFDNDMLMLNVAWNIKPFSFFSFQYDCKWGRNYSRISQGETFEPIHTLVNDFVVDFDFLKNVNLKLGFENYYNTAVIGRKNISFGDVAINYQLKMGRMSLKCNNVLNMKHFVSSSYNSMNQYQYAYDIRPASILFSVKFRVK